MADDIQAMSESEAGVALAAMFEEKKKLPPRGEKGKFTAVKPHDPRAEPKPEPKAEKPIPLTPADGSDDPDYQKGGAEFEEDTEPSKGETDAAADEEPEGEATTETGDEEEASKPRLHKVKVDGMEVEVDEEELKKGYSRTADYTRKTQELAEQRKKFETEEVAQYRQLIDAYAERLASVEEALMVLGPQDEPDWATLRVQLSPEEFTTKFAEYRAHQQRFEKVRGERQRIEEARRAETERQRQARLKTEFQKLQDALPELKDAEKGKALRDDLSAYARSVGYTDDDIAAVEDHRALVLLDKARRWDESQKRRPKIEDTIDRALDAMKPSVTKSKPKVSDVERGQARLAKTGSVDDAAALLEQTLFAPPKRRAG